MPVNRYRGEIDCELDGRIFTLCLTLGALAKLESHFQVDGLASLARRLTEQPLSASDIVVLLHQGLIGGGHDLETEDVSQMRHSRGAAGFAGIAAELLMATFSGGTTNVEAISSRAEGECQEPRSE